MHESSLVRSLLERVREVCEPAPLAEVEEVVVAIGPLAGVEPLLVASAFELQTRDTGLEQTRLRIEQVPLRLTCVSCGAAWERDEIEFACPACNCNQTRVVSGEGMIIRHIVLGDPERVMK
ncbi:MAG TPA: hydrogenase maturation nickel metallochaperone HypA [Pirellulaceae bacterium]|nr:hydrogenase maturation nickel metallochaperone HypA [Pirellulaceae bacterium]